MGATDGEIGKVTDFYFDDHTWTIRYLIVETGGWLSGRTVLISPQALLKSDWENNVFPVNLTKEQVKNSPDIDVQKPVSRQQEIELSKYYPWSDWGAGLAPGSLWGAGIGTTGMMAGTMTPLETSIESEENNRSTTKTNNDPQLRSYEEVKGYNIKAADGAIGDVEDFIVDDSSWKIDLLVVDTGHWLPGKKVLLSLNLIKEIKWATSSVVINASTNKVKNSPEYDAAHPLNEDYQTNLYNYYGNKI